jgi:hypothetical protein
LRAPLPLIAIQHNGIRQQAGKKIRPIVTLRDTIMIARMSSNGNRKAELDCTPLSAFISKPLPARPLQTAEFPTPPWLRQISIYGSVLALTSGRRTADCVHALACATGTSCHAPFQNSD